MKVRVDLFNRTVTTINFNMPREKETLSFEEVKWDIPEHGTKEEINEAIMKCVANNGEEIDDLIIWPKEVQLRLIEEQEGLYKKVYKVKGEPKYYVLIECGDEKEWFTSGYAPYFEADSRLHSEYPARFKILKETKKTEIEPSTIRYFILYNSMDNAHDFGLLTQRKLSFEEAIEEIKEDVQDKRIAEFDSGLPIEKIYEVGLENLENRLEAELGSRFYRIIVAEE